MKLWHVLVLCSFASLSPSARAQKADTAYPATYAGGNLPLDHDKVHAALGKDEVIFMQHGRRIAVPVKNITEISCGTQVHRHLVPLMHLGENESHYVGVAWTDAKGSLAKAQVLLKLNRAEYREFLPALERLTGIKAVDTNQVPTVVNYNL